MAAVLVPTLTGTGVEGVFHSPNSGRSETDMSVTAAACSADNEALCLDTPMVATESSAQHAPPVTAADSATRAVPVATATPAPEPPAEVWASMEIREGDTLLALADWFGLSPFDIASVNAMAVDDYLMIGATLAIPVPESHFLLPPDPMAVVLDLPVLEEEPVVEPEPWPAAVVLPPAPPPPVSSGSWTKEQVVNAICSLPWPCDQMVRIASCESGLRADAVNPAGYYGVFQIDHQFPGWDDPYVNAQYAYEHKYLPALAHGDGLGPWPVCRYF
ncbi:MAG: LysM peptidoglycan-binding domain-containing protein [Dehalococcoidia bacterium]